MHQRSSIRDQFSLEAHLSAGRLGADDTERLANLNAGAGSTESCIRTVSSVTRSGRELPFTRGTRFACQSGLGGNHATASSTTTQNGKGAGIGIPSGGFVGGVLALHTDLLSGCDRLAVGSIHVNSSFQKSGHAVPKHRKAVAGGMWGPGLVIGRRLRHFKFTSSNILTSGPHYFPERSIHESARHGSASERNLDTVEAPYLRERLQFCLLRDCRSSPNVR
jgi:hypothetical protein